MKADESIVSNERYYTLNYMKKKIMNQNILQHLKDNDQK